MLRGVRALASLASPLCRAAAGAAAPAAGSSRLAAAGAARPLSGWQTSAQGSAGGRLVGGAPAALLARPLWRDGGVWGARSMAIAPPKKPVKEQPNFNKKKETGARRYRSLIGLLQMLDDFGVGYRVARKAWVKFHPETYWVVTRTRMVGRNKKAYGVLVFKGVSTKKELKIRGFAKKDWKYTVKVEGEAEKLADEARLVKLQKDAQMEERRAAREAERAAAEAAAAHEPKFKRGPPRPGQIVLQM